ncbi:MAG: helix-turn-helix transcriptional regulator [Rhodothermales bacterium]|nr:helix-turn-helix transcriptional regulator [Rhodothermales bacterium]MBO6778154.1 helix-turn-helix transcriptional regulator [Rhodothermales bacterium]
MARSGLGEFEELVLLAVAALGDQAYGLGVRDMLHTEAGRSVSLGAVHAALYRLEDKGLLGSELGGATEQRGGRRKRLFRVTGSGARALESARVARERLRTLAQPALQLQFGA